jgi:hypothetical protein
MTTPIRQAVFFSDLHVGCSVALCPPPEVVELVLDDGGTYTPSPFQMKIWGFWEEAWATWVPQVVDNEPWVLVFNGDVLEGRHHNAITQWTQNLALQERACVQTIRWGIEQAAKQITKAGGKYPRPSAIYMVRGTEAHVGNCAENEESIGEKLGATPTDRGIYSRWQLALRLGDALVDSQHHIAAVNSNAYETTALQKEFVVACEEAGRWGREAPDVIVRSHRHRFAKTEVPTQKGSGIVVTTPGWQGKTPFVYRLAGGRQAMPQFGCIFVRHGREHIYTKHYVKSITPPQAEVPYA